MISSVTPIIITIGFISIDVHCAHTRERWQGVPATQGTTPRVRASVHAPGTVGAPRTTLASPRRAQGLSAGP